MGSCNLWSLKKWISACLFQIAREKSCDYVLIIYMEKYEMLIISKHKQSARIKCKNNLFKPCVQSKKHCFLKCFRCLSCFSAAVAKENLLKTPAIVVLANFQIFKFCCDIQGSHLIGYLRVSLIIDQLECLTFYFLCSELTLSCTELTLFCTELTLFCTELPENCIYHNQSELSNFSMYIINSKIGSERPGK